MSSATTEAVVIGRGFQLLSSYHFNHQIKCVAPQGTESVAVHYTAGSEHITSVCTVAPHSHSQKRVSVEKAVLHLLYVKKYRLYVMFCSDLTVRVLSETFQHIQTVHINSTVLCVEFVESTSTLYTGESGCVKVWQLRQQLHCPLVPQDDLAVTVGKDQWVTALDYEARTGKVVAATENSVLIIDANTHRQTASYASEHTATITGAVLFSSFGYLVLSFKDGSISVLNTVLHTVVHDLSGHIKAVTALKRHPTGSSFLSCSLDGTVRVWDLETLTVSCRLDFGKEIVDMSVSCRGSDTIQLVCHSYQDVEIWQLSQLESNFTAVNSHTVALSRVESPGTVRVVAIAEDGCVRLLSPVTGEVITIFFPIFTSKIVSDVQYCPLGGLLFALLRTSEVLVLSTHTNPCSTIELWTTREKDRIESLCMCLTEWKGKSHSLLFGGSVSGYIFLLHSSHFTMCQPCPAHGGCVCRLICPRSPVTMTDTTSTPCLLSYGSDNFLNVWSLAVSKKEDCVRLRMHICIQMETVPKHIGILNTLLCVTTIKNSVKMLNISTELKTVHQNRYLPHGCLFNSMPIMSHQREDCHTNTITSLSVCSYLGLFATSSRDGCLKVWSTSNQLVSEIYFGDDLTSACFSNARGDLLVGFQRQICVVRALNYLPSPYLLHSMECSINDRVEDPITFDPTLEFWYDPERVPAYQVQLEERSKYSTLNDYYAEPSEQQTASGERSSQQSMEGERKGVDTSPSEAVDVQLTKRDSHHFLASLTLSGSSIEDSSPLNKSGSAKESLSSLKAAILNGLGAIRSQDLVSALDKRQISKRATPAKRFPAEVTPLHSSSNKLPIAPDCLIPNSTIRELVGYVPAPDTAILQQLALAKADKILSACHSDTTQKTYKAKNHPLHRMPGTSSPDCTDETAESPSSEVVVNYSESESEECALFGNGLEEGVEICENDIQSPSESKTSASAVDLTSTLHVISDGSVTVVQPPAQTSHHEEDSVPLAGHKFPISSSAKGDESRPVHLNVPRNPSPHEIHSGPAVHTKVVPMVTIPFHMGPTQSNVATTMHMSSVQRATTSGAVGETHTHRVMDAHQEFSSEERDVKESELKGTKILQQIMKRPWFSSTSADMTAEKMCDGIVSMLGSADAAVIGDIGTALVQLKEVSMLTEAQISEMIQDLVSRLMSTEYSHTKQAILVTLERLGRATDNVLLAILPSLVDPNMEVRNSAFSTLKTIAGISNRSQLHHRLIQMGVLQHIEYDEDEILKDLSQRLESESLSRSRTVRTVTGTDEQIVGTPCVSDGGGGGCDGGTIQSKLCSNSCGKNPPITSSVADHQEYVGATQSSRKAFGELKSVSVGESRRGVGTRKRNTHYQTLDKDTALYSSQSGRHGARVQVSHLTREEESLPLIHRAATAHQTMQDTLYNSGQSRASCKSSGAHYRENSHLKRPDLTILKARLKCQPTLPINTTRSSRGMDTAESRDSVPSSSGILKQVKKLQKLLALQPTSFSQTTHARDMMVRAYSTAGREAGSVRIERQGNFKWTEVFPVLRENPDSRAGKMESTVSGRDAVILPKLAMSTGGLMAENAQEAYSDLESCTPNTTTPIAALKDDSGVRGGDLDLNLPQMH